MTEFSNKCNTCLAAFPSVESLKDHYRGDWHVLNSKRRAAGAAPLRREQFLQMLATTSSSAAAATSASAKKGTHKKAPPPASQHSPPGKAPVSAPPAPSPAAAPVTVSAPEKLEETVSTRTVVNGHVEVEDGEDSEWEDEVSDEDNAAETQEADEALYEPKLGTHISLFDDKDCGSMEDCLDYMARKYGFFIPDSEFLTDLPGLMEFLGEKVKLGGLCLFCQKRFPLGRAVQHHMIGKSHCKVAYEEGVDAEDLEDFYDFSATYEDLDEVEYDENGDPIQEEVEISGTGELVLPDGRVLGHRAFRRYYKQYYRTQDSREPVLAQQREELLRLGFKYGGREKSLEVSKLSDVEVMSQLVKYHKQIRRGQVAEQRAQIHKIKKDQRQEYNSKINKLRSSATTTAIIRDYHGTLK